MYVQYMALPALDRAAKVAELRALLREQHPSAQVLDAPEYGILPSGLGALDDLLPGGLPRGALTLFTGRSSSGKTGAVLAYLAEWTRQGGTAAWLHAGGFSPGSAAQAAPGMDVRVVDDSNREVQRGDIGALVVKLPLPPGTLPTLWNADDRFVETYYSEFPGYYKTADAGYIDDDGYVFVMSRTDDIINVAGHRLSTGAMEEVLAAHPDVAECAVIGVADDLKGQLPLGFLVLRSGDTRAHDDIVVDVVKMVRGQIGPVAAFKTATIVNRLPKTRSGKILRGTMQAIADGREYKMPATIDDPEILDEIATALQSVGYAGG